MNFNEFGFSVCSCCGRDKKLTTFTATYAACRGCILFTPGLVRMQAALSVGMSTGGKAYARLKEYPLGQLNSAIIHACKIGRTDVVRPEKYWWE